MRPSRLAAVSGPGRGRARAGHALVWTFALGLAGTDAPPVRAAEARSEAPRPLGAALEGPHALVAEVSRQLAARGVLLTTPGEGLRVSLAPAPEGLALDLRDAEGRTARRVVADAALATDVIEAWTRRDLGEALLRRPPPRLSAAAPATSAATPVVRLEVAAEAALGNDGGFLPGIGLGVCRPLAAFCLGLAGRHFSGVGGALLPAATFRNNPGAAFERHGYEALVIGDHRRALGPGALLLGLGLGGGRLTSRGSAGAYSAARTTTGLRAALNAAWIRPLASGWHAGLGLGLSFAPQATRDVARAGYFGLPAEPWALARFGLQLGYAPGAAP